MGGAAKSLLGMAVIGSVLATTVRADFPLRLNIDVNAKRSSRSVGAGSEGQAKSQKIQCIVKISKSGGQPYTEPLTAELYVIGEQIHTGHYGIIGVVKKEFTFSKENKNTFEFSSPMYSLLQTSGNIDTGGKYVTYLLVVVDKDGKIVDTRSGRSIGDKGIALIRELGPKTLFDKEGNVMGTADGSTVKKAIPAAVSVGEFGN